MKNKKVILLIGGIILAGVICFSLVTRKEDTGSSEAEQTVSTQEAVETLGNRVLEQPERHVTSPDIEAPQELNSFEDENGRYYRNLSGKYRFAIPDGFTLKKSGNLYYLRNEDNSIQLVLTVTAGNCESTDDMFTSRMNYMERMSFYEDEKEHDFFQYDTCERPEKQVGDYSVQCEETEAWFRSDDDNKIYKSPAYIYYTFLRTGENSGEETADSKGIMMMGLSQKDKSDVYSVMDTVLSSITGYKPTAEDLDPSYELETYKSEGKDAAQIAYPKGWDLSVNSDGMVIIRSTDDDSSPYANMIIEYMADENNRIVEDYAQFSGVYEYQMLLPYFTQPVGDSAFNYRTAVTKTDIHGKLGKKDCIYFEVEDEVIPVSKSIQNSMICDNYDITNRRYTFKANGVDCMLNFLVPKGSSMDLVEKLIAASMIP
ncbi:MAG: hypothetical protein ACI4FX_03240 [Agathobacter sp.]